MLCPVTKSPMLVLELENVEIDYCQQCGGVWLDADELGLLLGDEAAGRALIDSLQPAPNHKRRVKCPVCGKKMRPVAGGGVIIDRCPNGHGLWFDRGELPELVRHGGLDPDNRIASFFNDMFQED